MKVAFTIKQLFLLLAVSFALCLVGTTAAEESSAQKDKPASNGNGESEAGAENGNGNGNGFIDAELDTESYQESVELEKMESAEEEFFERKEFLPPDNEKFSPVESTSKLSFSRRHLLREYLPVSLTSEQVENNELVAIFRPPAEDNNALVITPSELTSQFDIPVEYNEHVQMYINFFTSERGRKFFNKWYERSGKFIPMLKPILEEYGLPSDTVFLAMIESGFSTSAYSRARAVGVWQFIASTGEAYGLRVNFWLDERRDPIKATHAAARFLNDLYQKFGDWQLAWAAYNAGGGKITRALESTGTDDFWAIRDTNHIRLETKHYVPKLIACAMVVKDPTRFGFDTVPRAEPIEYEEIPVNGAVDFRVIARLAQIPETTVKEFNPQYLRGMTVPSEENIVRLPKQAARLFAEQLPKLKPEERVMMAEYTVKKGDSLNGIARKLNSRTEAIQAFNSGKALAMKEGSTLKVPNLLFPGVDPSELKGRRGRGFTWRPRISYDYQPNPALKGKMHTVRRGENLWGIALKYNMPVEELMRINHIDPNNYKSLTVGTQLSLYGSGSGSRPATGGSKMTTSQTAPRTPKSTSNKVTTAYTVRSGDTLWDIAQRFGITVDELRSQNGLSRRSALYPGQKLTISYFE